MKHIAIFAFHAFPWCWIALWAYFAFFLPPTHWVTFDKIFIHDTVDGVPPVISFKAAIKREFVAKWHVIVRRANEADQSEFIAYCVTDGSALMYPDRKFPVVMTMDYWTAPNHCKLTPGVYYVETIWSWNAFGAEHSVVTDSNVFSVRAIAGSTP